MELTGKIVREKKLTTIMVTHNLRYAVEYGNRLLMMHQGHAILDQTGKDKEGTKVKICWINLTKSALNAEIKTVEVTPAYYFLCKKGLPPAALFP